MKYFNFKRYKFSTILKNLNILVSDFLNNFKYFTLKVFNYRKFFKYTDIIRLNFKKDIKYFSFKRSISYLLPKKILKSNNVLTIHLPAAIIFFGILYLLIPTFYNYDKSMIENIICKNNNIKCSLEGSISYRFYPTPRLKIKNVVINDYYKKENIFITAEKVIIKLSFKNLLAKEKHKFKKIELYNFKNYLDLRNFKKYINFKKVEIDYLPIIFKQGEIILFDEKNYVATISNVSLKIKFIKDFIKFNLKGKFLNSDILLDLKNQKLENKTSTDLLVKMKKLNFIAKINYSSEENDEKIKNGNFSFKKDKNKVTGIFNYDENKLEIKKSNIRNTFLDGKLEGLIDFFPYFNFDIDINLSSLNFTKVHNYISNLNETNKKKLFKINKKINGKLNLSTDKIYSKYNLIQSLESRLKFNNGNILIDQFLINLGKLGAADMLGVIDNSKKFTNLKFESNVFIDNSKKFLSKFNIYNVDEIQPNFFISGNFNLENLNASFYEISDDQPFSIDEINFIESEFNDLLLHDGYRSLFYFPDFKEFVKSISNADD